MNKKLALNIIPIIISFVIYNCNSSSDLKDQSNKQRDLKNKSGVAYNQYFPITEGNKWEYVNERQSDNPEDYIVKVNSVNNDGQDKIVELSSFPFFSKNEEVTRLRFKNDGSVYVMKDTIESMVFPSTNNLRDGYIWSFDEWNASVTLWKDTVITQNGIYTNCIFLNYAISITFSAEIWLAKDIGIVKWTYIRTNPPTFNPMYYVLKNMTLK